MPLFVLLPRTLSEVARELCARCVLLCWRSQRLREHSQRLRQRCQMRRHGNTAHAPARLREAPSGGLEPSQPEGIGQGTCRVSIPAHDRHLGALRRTFLVEKNDAARRLDATSPRPSREEPRGPRAFRLLSPYPLARCTSAIPQSSCSIEALLPVRLSRRGSTPPPCPVKGSPRRASACVRDRLRPLPRVPGALPGPEAQQPAHEPPPTQST